MDVHRAYDDSFNFRIKEVAPVDPGAPYLGVEVHAALTMNGRDVIEFYYTADENGFPEAVTSVSKS
jgi:hypothetical protein